MAADLVGRVSRTVLVLLLPVAVASAMIAGWSGGLGALSGGLISLASLNWIARGMGSTGGFFAGGRRHPLWAFSLGLRYVVLFGALGLLLGSGAAHPIALVGGLSVLPPVLVVLGLRAARMPS